MEYQDDNLTQIQRIEQLWQNQQQNLPDVLNYRFPHTADFYRYLDQDTLARHTKKIQSNIDKLRSKTEDITRALDWCYRLTPDEFQSLLSVIPWLLAVRDEYIGPNDMDYQLVRQYCLDASRDQTVKRLSDHNHHLAREIRYLNESLNTIELITSGLDGRPKPEPIIHINNYAYQDGDIVVGLFDVGYREQRIQPRALMVTDVSIGTYHLAVRPLSKAELNNLPLDTLPTMGWQSWMRRTSYDWIMPFNVFLYYYQHPQLSREHLDIIKKSDYDTSMQRERLDNYLNGNH